MTVASSFALAEKGKNNTQTSTSIVDLTSILLNFISYSPFRNTETTQVLSSDSILDRTPPSIQKLQRRKNGISS